VMHGDDDQIVPYADSGPLSAKLVQNGCKLVSRRNEPGSNPNAVIASIAICSCARSGKGPGANGSLSSPAEEAIRKGVFKPAKFKGTPVRQLVQQRISFKSGQ